MVQSSENNDERIETTTQTGTSRSLPISQRGINTGKDFTALMSCLMTDFIEGTISPQIATAVVNAGGKLLKVVEMQHKYGTGPAGQANTPPPMSLTGGD